MKRWQTGWSAEGKTKVQCLLEPKRNCKLVREPLSNRWFRQTVLNRWIQLVASLPVGGSELSRGSEFVPCSFASNLYVKIRKEAVSLSKHLHT